MPQPSAVMICLPVRDKRSHGHRGPAASHVDCSSRSTRAKSRRARTATDGPAPDRHAPEDVGIVDGEHGAKMWHQRRARRLVPAILNASRSRSYSPFCSAWTSERTRCRLKTASFREIAGGKRRACFRRRKPGERRRDNDQSQIVRPVASADARIGSLSSLLRQPTSCRQTTPPRRYRRALQALSPTPAASTRHRGGHMFENPQPGD